MRGTHERIAQKPCSPQREAGFCFFVKGGKMKPNLSKEDINILPEDIKGILERVQKNLTAKFQDNFRCLVLYGSWATGTAREDSDIDLLAVLDKSDKKTEKSVLDIARGIDKERSVTLVPCSLEDFQKEKIPLYTAVKKEGKIIYGVATLSINPEPPEIKYSGFFKGSREFESQKIRIAEEFLSKGLVSGIPEMCYFASKHAIQASLAMHGAGYSSKVKVLLPLVEKYFGNEFAETFRRLSELYKKSEYGVEFLTDEEAKTTIKYAKKILGVYQLGHKNNNR